MPKVGMQPIRRKQLIDAAIQSIHEFGLANATVARIANKAGVSPGIVHHYFEDKNDLLFATMRALLVDLRTEAIARLGAARTPTERVYAIIDASFSEAQFSPEVITAWLALYGSARRSDRLSRIVRIYARRLQSNLLHDLRQLLPAATAARAAEGTAALIDGLYLRLALGSAEPDPGHHRALTRDYVDTHLAVHSAVQSRR